jgi:hypothetical protein
MFPPKEFALQHSWPAPDLASRNKNTSAQQKRLTSPLVGWHNDHRRLNDHKESLTNQPDSNAIH